MKKIQSMLLGLALASSLSAQTSAIYQNGAEVVKYYSADSIVFSDELYLTDSDAIAWCRAHLDSLSDVAWQTIQTSTTPNKRDPDQNREVFRTIGYDGKNVTNYYKASAIVDSVMLERLIDQAVTQGKLSAVLISGCYGAGKSYSIRNNPEVQEVINGAGIVLEESFRLNSNLQQTVKKLRDAGITSIDQVHIYCDAATSFNRIFDRMLESGRSISYDLFSATFNSFHGYVETIERENITDHRYYIDNSGNNEKPRMVSIDEALKWNYEIDDALKGELLGNLYDNIVTHKNEMTYEEALRGYVNSTDIDGPCLPNTNLACVYSEGLLQGRYQLARRPIVTYADDELVLSVDEVLVLQIPARDVKVAFEAEGDVTGIGQTEQAEQVPTFSVTYDQIEARDLRPGELLQVLSPSGALLSQTVANEQGVASLSLPAGAIVIVRTSQTSFKVVRR